MSYSNSKLELVFGAMRSGKSSRMTALFINHSILKRKVNIYTPTITSLRDDPIWQFVKIKPVRIGTSNEDGSINVSDQEIELMLQSDIILIDEGQLISNIVPLTLRLLHHNKKVMIVSLCGDYRANLFGKVHELIPHADVVHKISGFCDICLENGVSDIPSIYSIRTDTSEDLIDINGSYKAACREHASQYIHSLKNVD